MEHPCQSSQYPWDKSPPLRKDCRLRRIGRLPHGFLTKSVTTLLPVDFQNGTKTYCIKSLWTNLCRRRLAIQLLPLSTSNIVKHPCSGTSSSCFCQSNPFQSSHFLFEFKHCPVFSCLYYGRKQASEETRQCD